MIERLKFDWTAEDIFDICSQSNNYIYDSKSGCICGLEDDCDEHDCAHCVYSLIPFAESGVPEFAHAELIEEVAP